LKKKTQRHNSRGSDGHRGSMSNVFSALFKRGEIIQRHPEKGRNPKESSSKGSSPKRRMVLFH
jgi:hypothetical protein